MHKNYIKEIIPGGKRYRALWYGRPSKRKFTTATAARIYAYDWRARYRDLLFAKAMEEKDA